VTRVTLRPLAARLLPIAAKGGPSSAPKHGDLPSESTLFATDHQVMEVAQVSPETAVSLIDGYCDDFISLAAVLAQTLEQVSMRGIDISDSTDRLRRISSGMTHLSEAITAAIAAQATPRSRPKEATKAAHRRRTQDPKGKPQPSLKGCNRSMPIRSVFQFLERMRKDGVIKVRLADEILQFAFEQGRMTSCSTNSDSKGDLLADLLEDGCDDVQLPQLLQNIDKTDDARVREVTLQAGVATKVQINQAKAAQLRLRFARACDAPDARYAFLESPPPANK